MTEYNLGPYTFHLGSGECVLLTGRGNYRQLFTQLSRQPGCVRVLVRRPLCGMLPAGRSARSQGALTLLGLKPGCKWNALGAVDRIKFCIAMALNQKVEVLLLDHPTRDLDPEERQLLLGAMRDLVRKTGMTILFTSHDLTDALAIANRVLAFTPGGRLLESTPDTREAVLRAAYPLLHI